MSALPTDKVIVLGFDGLSPHILEPLMEAGRAPHFARLRDAGAYRRLRTSIPSQSPVAWSTIATGSNPGHHGVFDFIRRDPRRYRPELAVLRVNPRNVAGRRSAMFLPVRQGTAFWAVTSQAGVPTTVIRWPLTLPPEPVHGRMLAGLGVPDLKANLGRYTLYTTRDVPEDEAREMKGDVVALPPGQDALETEVRGPEGSSPVPLSVEVDRGDRAVRLRLAGQECRAEEGTWSERVRLSFPLRLRKPVAGQCRFYLHALEPHLALLLSPIEADPRQPAFVLTHPDAYASELAEAIGPYHTLGMPEDTNALGDGCLDPDGFLDLCETVMAERERMLWHELGRLDRGCLAFVFDTSDRVQHVFWGAHEPGPDADPAAVEHYGGVIRDFYARMDALLGRVLDGLDGQTGLIVLSDHGFGAFRRAVHLNSWLAAEGLLTLEPAADRHAALFRHVDWRKTQAYALGFSSLYLNLRRREGRGLVHPREAEALKRRIAERLRALEDPATGRRVVHEVYDTAQLYRGPCLGEAPDLVVGFAPGYRASWQTAIGGCPKGIVEENTEAWCGDHLCDSAFVPGILFVNRPLAGDAPHVGDVAPTALQFLGLDAPPAMEGTGLLG